ncbi:HXXEE domain-containing protein [Aquabacter cavernae]|uniref:HXXEE domain-containing protein n=1 Tax=Aquabacter cavernae TaxID=2496029 RepID=UPI000F8EB509|nr:HXXEE domain-containing protein [Aquabacter cavernae]
MMSFAVSWPWIALGAALVLFVLLAAGDGLATDRRVPRGHDLTWLAWLGFALSLLHQFEESGIDLFGRPYALLGALCTGLGYRDAVACPVPLSFLTAYNAGAVWLAGLFGALAASRRPLLALTVFALPLGNLILQIGAAMGLARYNPGLGTGLLMLPLAAWAMLVAMNRHKAGLRALAAVLGAAVLSALVTVAGLAAVLKGVMGEGLLAVLLVLLAALPAGLMLLASRQPAPAPAPVPARSKGTPTRRAAPRRPREPASAA